MLMSSADKTAKLYYGPSSFRVLRPGRPCAVRGDGRADYARRLRYWSAERQEAYVSCEIATRRLLGLDPA
jgi:hypothetical protein